MCSIKARMRYPGGLDFYHAQIECGPLSPFKEANTKESCKTLCWGYEGRGREAKEGRVIKEVFFLE